jgi:hypothetical protein
MSAFRPVASPLSGAEAKQILQKKDYFPKSIMRSPNMDCSLCSSGALGISAGPEAVPSGILPLVDALVSGGSDGGACASFLRAMSWSIGVAPAPIDL